MSRQPRKRQETWWLLAVVVLLCSAVFSAWFGLRERDWLPAVIAVNNTGIAVLSLRRLRELQRQG